MSGVSIGYARVSSQQQDLAVQLEALAGAGCERVFSEKVSGKSKQGRDELEKCLSFVRDGDTLIVTRLDRLGRSVRDLLDIVERLASRGVKFRCLQQPIFDINDSTSKMFFTMLAGFAEFELNIRKERQIEGIARAKADGRYKGGKAKYDAKKTIRAARNLKDIHGWGATAIAMHLKMSVRTLYRITSAAEPPLWGPTPINLDVETFDVSAEPRRLNGHPDAISE